MKFIKITFFFFLLFVISIIRINEAFSQVNQTPKAYYLTFNKPGIKKRTRFYIGDELKFKLKEEDFKRTATITAIDSNSITINGVAKIPLEDFRVIQLSKKRIKAARMTGTTGGVLFMALGLGNTLLEKDGSEVLIVSGFVALASVQFLRFFENRNYKLNSYRYLRTVPQWEGLNLEQ
ncbi:hypothetical protein Fleli_3904 [Bernardetia litoralis DSM 6794]|uniref:Uncharacterized protein n=1 Tax=Bernardetia litoralis (strain ATCC 23117 / DSM 6794 / NBRC 15988 / NCIMB 1366 / Fx l1 / Sio-4) TaxID=880071 RepID=I4AQH2_BERLS|nr:hypothetical protein [Bernardetia litoralis]AFM06207.1 hypothetical protein Fleli_3904 [Bernardetia litoralis DSM 6794]